MGAEYQAWRRESLSDSLSANNGSRPWFMRTGRKMMVAEPQKQDVSLEEALSAGELDEDKRKRVEELIEEEEGATNRLGGWLGTAVVAFAVFVSLIHLYAAVAGSPPFTGSPIIATYTLRPLHVGLVLALI